MTKKEIMTIARIFGTAKRENLTLLTTQRLIANWLELNDTSFNWFEFEKLADPEN